MMVVTEVTLAVAVSKLCGCLTWSYLFNETYPVNHFTEIVKHAVNDAEQCIMND